MSLKFGQRRGVYVNIADELKDSGEDPLQSLEDLSFQKLDQICRAMCAMMYNYVPMSGHPGGSISKMRYELVLWLNNLKFDLSDPLRHEADIFVKAAGHTTLGLYVQLAVMNEIARLGAPELLSDELHKQFRLEDLLGFRRNPVTDTPLFNELQVKPLDGHPTPATPFVWVTTGASGVGTASSAGLALGAMDYYGKENTPNIHVTEGEGGMTPGRVSETLAMLGSAQLGNYYLHVDWNQSSIDSDKVCRDGQEPGDYVQWDPMEFCYLHDFNVIEVPDGHNLGQIAAAQKRALQIQNNQPTAIVYRTTKGWNYGIEGKKSHGAGYKLCSEGFYGALKPFCQDFETALPACEENSGCRNGADSGMLESCFWKALQVVRQTLEDDPEMVSFFAGKLKRAKLELDRADRQPRNKALVVENAFDVDIDTPAELQLSPGEKTTLRGQFGACLGYLNKQTGGAVMASAADLLGSVSIDKSNQGFPGGYFNAESNLDTRIFAGGGICEDAISGILSGLAAYGKHIGAAGSYGAFIAPLGHIAARLHAIGMQARKESFGVPYNPFILLCGHAGLETGEDGSTHADPQPLQLLQENFPQGTMITLTPWEPREIWPLLTRALQLRPAVIAPFVTRPSKKVELGALYPHVITKGIYKLHKSGKTQADGSIVLQGSGVTYAFVQNTLPRLMQNGVEPDVYYVSSAELFDLLPRDEQQQIFSEQTARRAMGITGFTLSTMYRWITSDYGRKHTLHPFKIGHYPGSGQAHMVMKEAQLDGDGQFDAIIKYVEGLK